MCFSAAASFSAGIVLTGMGVAAVKETESPKQILLAGIPLLFGVQQLIEGILWLSLRNPEWSGYQHFSMMMFLLIAQVIWPVWLPAAFVMFEPNEKRKKLIRVFIFSGLLVAGYFLYCLITYPVSSMIRHHHIFYDLKFPVSLIPYAAFVYVVSTVAPAIFSTNRKVKWIGIIILIFYILSRLMFQPSLISVWCFFASVVAILAYMVIREENKKARGGLVAGE
jgi:hypothetical protein